VLSFVAIGLDHTSAGVELRERLAFADGEIPVALRRLTDPADPLLDQAAILSTCNRVEVYGVAGSRPDEQRLAAFLAEFHGLDAADVVGHLSVLRDDQAAHRLAQTAAGMHSLILGEAQIQGQIRRALEHALAAGTAGPELRRVFETAVTAGRRVRARTAIGRGALSLPHAAVAFANRRLGTLARSTVLVIGTGAMGELTTKHLAKCGVKDLLILGRTPSRARRLAALFGGRAIDPGRLDEVLTCCNVVISATGAPGPILDRERLRRAIAPLLLIDLSVPRAVDPGAAGLPGVELHVIDDMRGLAERTLAQRRAALPEASAIVDGEVARLTDWLRRREAVAQTSLVPAGTQAGQ
jgi:glutamyl-tRNA reductase